MNFGNLNLQFAWLTSTIAFGEGSSTPGRSYDSNLIRPNKHNTSIPPTTMDLIDTRQLRECVGVSQRHVNHTMMDQGGHAIESSDFLSSTRAGGGAEDGSVFPMQRTSLPQLASGIPKYLIEINMDFVKSNVRIPYFPLGRHHAITSGHTEKESVVFDEFIESDNRIAWLGRRTHFRKNIRGKGLRYPGKS